MDRLKLFKEKLPATQSDMVDALLCTARRTLIEFDYAIACVQSLSNVGLAKDSINASIAMMEKAEVDATSLHQGLWSFACQVLQGIDLK